MLQSTIESVHEILIGDHSNENKATCTEQSVFFCGTVCYAVHGGSTFLTSLHEILKCGHSSESY